MIQGETNVVFWILAASCAMGVLGAILVRRSEGSSRHVLCTWLFHACLLAVGITAILFIRVPSGLGLLSGATLAVMMVGTTCDFRSGRATSAA